MNFKRITYSVMLLGMTAILSAQSTSGNEAVGTPSGALTVSDMGAAVYNLNFEVPDGGPLTPQIGIAYNSQQAGYGLAGYGFNITGISCITRGGKDMFHDQTLQGVTYTADDNFYLDGKRLILKEGTHGEDGSKYCLEGDPYTEVTLHIKKHQESKWEDNGYWTICPNHEEDEEYIEDRQLIEYEVYDEFWFKVTTNTGMIYEYGKTSDSQLSISTGEYSLPIVVSWYINRVEDIFSNYMTYEYTANNYVMRPSLIEYGLNRGITNLIEFEYQSLGTNERTFYIKSRQGKMDVCLSSVTTSSNGKVYRKYTLGYDNTSDSTEGKWTRLTSVTEENGQGEKLRPIKLDWEYLPTNDISGSQIQVSTNTPLVKSESDKSFFAVDLNGDGISDIVRLSNINNSEVRVTIAESRVSESGKITFDVAGESILPLSTIYEEKDLIMQLIDQITGNSSYCQRVMNGFFPTDVNGDGYNDIVIPYHSEYSSGGRVMYNEDLFFIIDIKNSNKVDCKLIKRSSHFSGSSPLYTALDMDGDGKDEILSVDRTHSSSGVIPCFVVKVNDYKGSVVDTTTIDFSFNLHQSPQRLFTSDYNNDGLTDLIVLFDDGYKIYYNNGGNDPSTVFSESNTKTGINVRNFWRIEQGDFDGDGLVDFVYNVSGETCLKVAHNNGNGCFTCKEVYELGMGNWIDTNKDDDKFSLKVLDINHDGLSDVMVCKAGYNYEEGFLGLENYYEYNHTVTFWLYSDGNTLKLGESYTKQRKDDALESSIFLGDFDGDGYVELANYGSNLLSTDDTFEENKINIYSSGRDLSQVGKITSITDGLGNRTSIQYAYTTSPEVYAQTEIGSYPMHSYTLPMPVVSQVTLDGGEAGNQVLNYRYKDLKIHIAGGGLLGFKCVVNENVTMGTKDSTVITKWDEKRLIPSETESYSFVGDFFSRITSKYKIEPVNNTYFAYVYNKEAKDLDGHLTHTETEINVSDGTLSSEYIWNECSYKKVVYSNYQKTDAGLLPGVLKTSRWIDSSGSFEPFTTTTKYTYDEQGNVTQKIENCGTHWELKTAYSHDDYGNVLSSVSSGWEVTEIKDCYEYDASGRYLLKHYTIPASTVTLYTYDMWGNLLAETDATDPSNLLTTSYTYDGWGRVLTSLSADSLLTEHQTGWDTSNGYNYYTRTQSEGCAPVTAWYDNAGHKILEETIGKSGVAVSKKHFYDKGRVSKVQSTIGKLTTEQSYQYDERGRVVLQLNSSGKSVTYKYEDLTVETTVGNQTKVVTSDACGNVIKVTDASGTVEYKYHSCGKPRSIKAHGSEVIMKYDAVGNQITLIDPDAGEMSYDYAADGTLITQQDTRGVMTTNTFDELGRISYVHIGDDKTVSYTYGTSGNEKMQLVKKALDDCTIEYSHDKFGRVVTEKRIIKDCREFSYSYEYNNKGQIVQIHYPNGLDVSYEYDEYGFKTKMYANGEEIYHTEKYDGLTQSAYILGKLTSSQTLDAHGYLSNLNVKRGMTILENMDFSFDVNTSNLLSRQRSDNPLERFTYDNLDRLVSVRMDDSTIMQMNYAVNGNILSKSDVGDYNYANAKPHAVTGIENMNTSIANSKVSTSFNSLGKIQRIEQESPNVYVDFVYGPDLQRWYTSLSNEYKPDYKTIFFAGDYEEVIVENQTTGFYFLEDNIIIVKKNGKFTPFFAFKDNIGSILSVIDEDGTKVFDASYDVWGKQTVKMNTIGLHRGYTGHEMLDEFGIINMNGRLYDPTVGCFLSTDNYVQAPTNSQNFNRYSYCLNNPLKYTDPSGEFFTWSIGKGGCSIGVNFTPWGIPLGGGLNFGWSHGFSMGVYGEAGYRVGGNQFGGGATISRSYDYNFKYNNLSSTTSAGVYASLGPLNVGGNASLTYDFNSRQMYPGWSVSAGVGYGGIGANVSYGSGGWSHGVWGYYYGKPKIQDCVMCNYMSDEATAGPSVPFTDDCVTQVSKARYGNVNTAILQPVGSLPEDEGYVMDPVTHKVKNKKGEWVYGCTVPKGKNQKAYVYIFEDACRSQGLLELVLGHEYMHSYYMYHNIPGSHHDEIYRWQALQAKKWGMLTEYKRCNAKHFAAMKELDDVMSPYTTPKFDKIGGSYGIKLFTINPLRPRFPMRY